MRDITPLPDQWQKHKTDEALLFQSILEGGGDAYLEVAFTLDSSMFSTKEAVNLWVMFARLYAVGIPLSFANLYHRLSKTFNDLDEATNRELEAYLLAVGDYMADEMTFGHHVYYAGQVAKNAQKRVTYQLCQQALAQLTEDADPQQVVTGIVQATDRLVQRNATGALSTADISAKIDEERARGEQPKEYFTGIKTIDAYLDGKPIVGGNVVVIAGDTGFGKTTLALNIAYNNAKLGHKVLLISFEMTAEENYTALAKLPTYDMMTFTQQARGIIDALPVFIDDNGNTTLAGVENSIRQQQLKEGVDIVIIDHISLMTGEGHSTADMMKKITNGLKQLAQRMKLPIFELCHLNRQGKAIGARPTLNSLKDSSTIEQDANKVFLIHVPDIENRHDKVVIVAKNRGGKLGDALVTDYFRCGRWKSRSNNALPAQQPF